MGYSLAELQQIQPEISDTLAEVQQIQHEISDTLAEDQQIQHEILKRLLNFSKYNLRFRNAC
jgi:peptidoglycan hydrolase CwlO-like protein